jgi:hypothetical protein
LDIDLLEMLLKWFMVRAEVTLQSIARSPR